LRRQVAIRDVFAASLDAGADDYICKPFDPEELRARLRMGLQAMRLRNQVAACEHRASGPTGSLEQPQNPPLAASGSAGSDYGKTSIQAALVSR
jgi:DNA-binding response OmpR family regulator